MEVKNLYYRSGNIHFRVAGNGEPIVLLHGYQADSRIWDLLIERLLKKYKIIVPDLPGHGKSPVIQPINTMDFFADVVNKICLSMRIEYITLAGHSMGGYAALAFAAKFSPFVNRLFLINSHPFDDSMAQVLARNRETDLLKLGKKHLLIIPNTKSVFYNPDNPELKDKIDFATNLAIEQPVDGMIADLAGMMARPDLSSVLEKGKYPVHIVYGSDELKFPEERISLLASEKVKHHRLKGCGHISILEKPEEVAEILLN